MAKPRLPAAVAKATGAAVKNPQRFRGRKAPKVQPLGPAPKEFTAAQRAAWNAFAEEMPWLGKSDRMVVETASRLRARMQTEPDFPIGGYAQLRMCLSAMGGTPTDRTKVSAPDDDEDDEDPAAEFVN